MSSMTRRNVLKKTVTAAGGAGALIALPLDGHATTQTAKPKLEKKAYPAPKDGPTPLFSSAISYGNLLFLAGVGAHFEGTVEQHTTHVLDELEKTLTSAGSSMEKVLKVNVYLSDIKDWPAMNTVYAGRWGKVPPVRTTVAPGGLPGNSLVEIDLIAYI